MPSPERSSDPMPARCVSVTSAQVLAAEIFANTMAARTAR